MKNEKENDKLRMRELIDVLNSASRAYYTENREEISNFQYDALYDELCALEAKTGIIFSSSPTQNVGYEILENLEKERHTLAMLSLDKTKSADELETWLEDKDGVLSWKLDGLTIVLTYEKGKLQKAVTRGNGQIGEVVTSNAKKFKNVPLTINFQGQLIVRGEAFISYSDFNRINDEIPETEAKYKNPRNLCSGSVRQLNSEITEKRNVNFKGFSVGSAIDENGEVLKFENSFENSLQWLSQQGFDTVDFLMVNKDTIKRGIDDFYSRISSFDIPTDGLVLTFDDISYGESLGQTSKFPKNAIAFKWQDEVKETILKEILWSPSRTGLINPIAVFEPIELEGTMVSRASVHNVSILRELSLSPGDTIKVYKANMIIPQIAENITRQSTAKVIEKCPACNSDTAIQKDMDVEVLVCPNKNCPAKSIKAMSLFVSRDAMNIENLSEATLEKFVAKGFLTEPADIYKLHEHEDEIISMDGFGRKSYDNLMISIDNSRSVEIPQLLYSLGIAGIGVSNSKNIAKHFEYNWESIKAAREENFLKIDGIGDVMARSLSQYFSDDENKRKLENLEQQLHILKTQYVVSDKLKGKTFVITGSLNRFENRNALKAKIESEGGKVSSAVSGNTDFLINNDKMSKSSKNKKAAELGIAVISEDDFMYMIENRIGS